MSAPVCFVDTETTGLDPDRHEIWEVGLIVDDAELRWFLTVDAGRADAIALKIGGFHERHPNGRNHVPNDDEYATPLQVFAEEFAGLTSGRHLVGAVISFDEERLRKLLRANRACPEWHYHLIDVEALAAGFLTGQFTAIQEVGANPESDGPTLEEAMCAVPPWDSEALSMAVGVNPEDFDRHTALGDARWAKAIYEAALGKG